MYDASPFRFFFVGEKKNSAEEDLFRVFGFNGVEETSQTYTYHLNLVFTNPFFDPGKIIGQSANLLINGREGAKERLINGLVLSFEQAGTGNRFTSYRLTLVPRLRLLIFGQNCRIFQDQSVAQIIEKVLRDREFHKRIDYDIQITSKEHRNYCVQYRESDYYFKHSETRHLMIISDNASNHPDTTKNSIFEYHNQGDDEESDGMIAGLGEARQLATNKVTPQDYHFEEPQITPLKVQKEVKQEPKFEHYDYPGLYAQAESGKKRLETRF